MLTFPAPAVVDGDLLAGDLVAAGLSSAVYLSGQTLHLPGLDESDRSAAQSVLNAHPPKAQTAANAATKERTNETTIRQQATSALTANKTFLDSAIPATAAARLARLEQEAERAARQRSGLIRLLLNRFDGTD